MQKLKNTFNALPTPELAAKGKALLSGGTYKESIEIYKQLLKREQREEWRNDLATAYLGRAKELAGKAMYKEAAMVWENIVNLGGQILQPELYIDWLLRGNQYPKAIHACTQFEAMLKASGASEGLETLSAALVLAEHKDIVQVLPANSALRQDQASARAALHAYCQDVDEADVREHLKRIAFRSPYKDFRQILNALLKLESDPAGALLLLDRLASDSPYQGIAAVIRACANGAVGVVANLLGLDHAQQEMAANLLGLDQRQLRLLKQWSGVRATPSDKALFHFVTHHLPALDREQARRTCLNLLPAYPHGLRTYTELFGPLSPFEAERVQALRAEREHDYHEAVRYWQACVKVLQQDHHNPDGALAIALILRHMAEQLEHHAPDWEPAAILNHLEESLRWDPDDKATYLKLADLNKKTGNLKAYSHWVERAIKQFPEDSQVLLTAMEAATARKAFKKAASFAALLLDLDPINTKARTVLINSHLSHARKLILAGKYGLAEKELDSASQLEREDTRSGMVEITRGLLAWHLNQQDRLQHELRKGLRAAGSPLLAHLRLAVETLRLKLEPEDFLPYLDRIIVPSRAETLALVRLINAYREEGFTGLDSVLEDLAMPLKKAAGQLSTKEDMQAVCDCLRQVPHFELLEHFATQALTYWKEQPLFVYYQIVGRAEGNLDNVSDRDYDHLERAWERAEAAKDNRTAMLIDQFLKQDFLLLPKPGVDIPSIPMDVLEGLEQLRKELLSVPARAREALLDQLIKEMPPDMDGFPPELRKHILKILLLPGSAENKPPDILEGLPFPVDFPPLPQPRRKRKKR
jgi:tetratricopeptide (TPR) repeat protein